MKLQIQHATALLASVLLCACIESRDGAARAAAEPAELRSTADGLRTHDVMESAFCAPCHPDAYAEHEQSTHGRAAPPRR